MATVTGLRRTVSRHGEEERKGEKLRGSGERERKGDGKEDNGRTMVC